MFVNIVSYGLHYLKFLKKNKSKTTNNMSIRELIKEGDISDEPLSDYIDNFYMTDSISRSSKTMAECTINLNNINKEIDV